MKSNELRILTEDALEAFWAVVAQRYPQASSGDLPIDISLDLQGLAELAIATWIQSNVPRQS